MNKGERKAPKKKNIQSNHPPKNERKFYLHHEEKALKKKIGILEI